MKKQNVDVKPAERVIRKLSGHFDADRKILLNAIYEFHNQNEEYVECATLGMELYKLLLNNGLNESDVVNHERLLGKIDGFVYAGNMQMATDIIDVLDALEVYQKFNPQGEKVYCFENDIEEEIFKNSNLVKGKQIVWLMSNRPMLLANKAKILLDNQQNKDAEKVLNELYDINPINFECAILKASLLFESKPEKFKELVLNAWKFAYTPRHMLLYFNFLTQYYTKKKDWTTVYAIISANMMYDTRSDIEADLNYVKSQINKTLISSSKVPTNEEIVAIMAREKINVLIPMANFEILLEYYKKHYMEKDNPFVEEVVESINAYSREDVAKKIRVSERKKKIDENK